MKKALLFVFIVICSMVIVGQIDKAIDNMEVIQWL